jgi:threonine dehydrogenase-like Zn-dependent dehydrogenase
MSVFIGTGLVFVGERDCRAEEVVIDEATLQPGQLVIELEVSVVSAGTEVANFTGLDPGTRVPGSWNAYPHRPGYGAVGRVVAIGPPLPGLATSRAVGDRVFAICRHASYSVADLSTRPIAPISAEDDAHVMILARMASVAVTAVRKSSRAQLGARAVVVGLGLVGNFAAQLLQLAGMNVIGLDLLERRVEMARATGLMAMATDRGALGPAVTSLAKGADLVVEASGVPDALPTAISLVRDGGEVVLLGTPRGTFSGDATQLFVEIHRRGLTVVGALEWLLPLQAGAWQARWSLNNDYEVLFDLLRRGLVKTNGLVTEIVGPDKAQDVYTRLAAHDPSIGAVLFDWRRASGPN